MNFMKDKVKGMNVLDIAVLKTYAVLIGMVAGAYLSAFVQAHLWNFIVAIVILMMFLIFILFFKGSKE